MAPDFQYAQFCPVARAAEILGERWTLLVVRELLCGPQRFSDLRRGLPGVSASVLSERLARLEERGVVSRRELPPPAPATVYEMTALGAALREVVEALARWGARLLAPPRPGEDLPPRALRFGLTLAARRTAVPQASFAVCASDGARVERFRVLGGPGGTEVREGDGPADLRVTGAPFPLVMLAVGALDPHDAVRSGALQVEGDAALLARFAELFDPTFSSGSVTPGGGPALPTTEATPNP